MKALILNSGIGKRMGDFTISNHKSMARLSNGETIFSRQLRLLVKTGVTDFVITTGPFAEQLHAETQSDYFAAANFTFVHNDRYEETNYIYSMHLARDYLDEDLLVLHGDLVFNEAAISAILRDERPDLGMFNPNLPPPEKDFKARVVDGQLEEVSVSIFGADCYAFQPLYKLSRRTVKIWLKKIAQFVDNHQTSLYAEDALNEVSDIAAIQAFSYDGKYVNEVDTQEDLHRVSNEIRLFDFAEQPVFDNPNAFHRIVNLLQSVNAQRPLLVGGKSFEYSFIKKYLDNAEAKYVRFSEYSPNPTDEDVRVGHALFIENSCDSVISFGGGSAIDVAKCIKALAASNDADYPAFGAPLNRYIPHLAFPTTAGTGSESTHFAVVYVNGEKHSIVHDALMPEWVILDPNVLETLPEYHKKASVMDALAQCVESLWAPSATPQSKEYALTGIDLILHNLFAYFHKGRIDKVAATRILVAANLSGKAINLTKTSAPHAMSYAITSIYGLAHGHAAALCLSGVWRYFVKLASLHLPQSNAIVPALNQLAEVFKTSTPLLALDKFDAILNFLQLAPPSVSDPSDINQLVASVNEERLNNSPVPLSELEIKVIYEYVLSFRSEPFIVSNIHPVSAKQLVDRAQHFQDILALQRHDLEILEVFDVFCSKHDLTYYLSEGTMLGAIRHGGFVPWDDDVDVMMPRAHYRKFVKLAKEGKLPLDLTLDCFDTNRKHWVFGAKLETMRETAFSQKSVSHLATKNGPHIDIFPLDTVLDTSGPRFELQKFLLRLLRRMLFLSSGYSLRLRVNLKVRVPLWLFGKLLTTPGVHKLIIFTQTYLNSSKQAQYLANLCTYYPIEREIFPIAWFGKGRRVMFENLSLVVPLEAEKMLRSIYGPDWMGIPSLKTQNSRPHYFTVDRNM